MKLLIYLLVSASLLGSCKNGDGGAQQGTLAQADTNPGQNQNTTITVSGNIANAAGRQVFLQLYPLALPGQNPQAQIVDTSMVGPDGSYQLTGTIDQKHVMVFGLDNQHVNYLLLDGGNYVLNADYNNFSNYDLQNAPENKIMASLLSTVFANFQQINNLTQQLQMAQQAKQSAEQIRAIQEQLNQSNDQLYNYLRNFIDTTHSDVSALFAAELMDIGAEFDYIKGFSEKMNKKLPNSRYTQHIAAKVRDYESFIGKPAPEIKLPNPDGDSIALSSLRGKLVLLDFWAAWCRPCRVENPNVVRLYDRYKDKGFTVYSVSLDRNKQDWVNAISADNLKWKNHVSELKFWQGQAHQQYGVNSIPATFLINEKGEIIGKNLRGYALERRVSQLLDKK